MELIIFPEGRLQNRIFNMKKKQQQKFNDKVTSGRIYSDKSIKTLRNSQIIPLYLLVKFERRVPYSTRGRTYVTTTC